MVDTIIVISPNGGEIWAPGSTHNITWTRTGGTLGPNIKIELYKGGVFNRQLVYAQPGTSYSWVIPADLAIGTDYKIRIMGCTLDSTGKCIAYLYNMSDANFTIGTAPTGTLTVTSPMTGVVWEKGTTHNITWTTTGTVKPGVKIELYKGSTFNRQIVYESPVAGGNSYSWIVPTDLVSGTDYKIRIMACVGTTAGCTPPTMYLIDYSDIFTINDPTVVCNDPICNLVIS